MAHKTSILEDGPDWLERKIRFIIEDEAKVPKHPKGTPEETRLGYEVFASVGPKRVHPRGWTGFDMKTGEGVHREGGRGESKPSPGQVLTLRPRSTDFQKNWDGFGMV